MPAAATAPAPTERRLRASDRRPEQAFAEEEAKRAFLRMVSHELRTPLNAIIGFSEVIADEFYGPLGSPQYKEYACIVQQSGKQLLTLVNQILELARLESGVCDLEPGVELLPTVLAEAAQAVRADAEPRGVNVVVAPVDASLAVVADPRALATILGTLLARAVSDSPEGETVTVRTRALATRVLIEIEDRGAGCDRRDLPRLTRPFEQGGGALNRAASGLASGAPAGVALGLPIARLLAEASGGSLRLRSAPGAGMTALLSLPRA